MMGLQLTLVKESNKSKLAELEKIWQVENNRTLYLH